MIVQATTNRTAGREAGLSLVEILIAMFVFMVGILGVLSLFPVAMNSASKAIGEVRTNTLAESAISQLTVDCHAPVDSGIPQTSATDTLVREAGQDIDRTGYFVTMTAGPAKGQSRIITSCSTNTLNVFPVWDPYPDPTTPTWTKPGESALDKYIVTRLGLPKVRDEGVKTRDGFVREIIAPNVFHAGRPISGDTDAVAYQWPAKMWDPQADPVETVTGQSDNTVTVSGSPWSTDQSGKFVLIHQMNSSTNKPSPARGQIRLITETISASELRVFPDWSVNPETNARLEVRKVPGYFILFTNGRVAGRIIPIVAHEDGGGLGDKFTLPDDVDLNALGVTQAKRMFKETPPEYNYEITRATSFLILGSDSVISTVLPNQNYLLTATQIDDNNFPPAESYFFNSFGFAKDAEPQTGADIFNDLTAFYDPDPAKTATYDRVASEYSAVCIFSNNGMAPESSIATPFHTLPVRVDVLVFLSYAQSKSPFENRKAVGYMTGYIERP